MIKNNKLKYGLIIIGFSIITSASVVNASIIDSISNAISSVFKSKKEIDLDKSEARIEDFIDRVLYDSFDDEKKDVVKTIVDFENTLYKADFNNLYKYLDLNKNNRTYADLIEFLNEDENAKKFIKLFLEESKFDILSINPQNNNIVRVELQTTTLDIEDLGRKVIPKILSNNILGLLTNKLVIDNDFISKAFESANSIILNEEIRIKEDVMNVNMQKQNGKYVFMGTERLLEDTEESLKNMLNVMNE